MQLLLMRATSSRQAWEGNNNNIRRVGARESIYKMHTCINNSRSRMWLTRYMSDTSDTSWYIEKKKSNARRQIDYAKCRLYNDYIMIRDTIWWYTLQKELGKKLRTKGNVMRKKLLELFVIIRAHEIRFSPVWTCYNEGEGILKRTALISRTQLRHGRCTGRIGDNDGRYPAARLPLGLRGPRLSIMFWLRPLRTITTVLWWNSNLSSSTPHCSTLARNSRVISAYFINWANVICATEGKAEFSHRK